MRLIVIDTIKKKVDVILIILGFEIPKVINVYYVDTIVVGRNRGPNFGNVRNTVPWILMIGASKLGKKIFPSKENDKFSKQKWFDSTYIFKIFNPS